MWFFARFIICILLSVVSIGFASTLFASGGGQCHIVGDDIAQTLKDCSRGTAGIDAGEFWGSQDMTEFRDRVRLFSGGAMRYAALFAIAAIVVAGIMYVTAYGDEERIKTAKTTVKFALLGLVLALLSFSLVNALMYFIYGLGA